MRLIDADELYEYLRTKWDGAELVTADGVIMAIEDAPTVNPLKEVLETLEKDLKSHYEQKDPFDIYRFGRVIGIYHCIRIVRKAVKKYETD